MTLDGADKRFKLDEGYGRANVLSTLPLCYGWNGDINGNNLTPIDLHKNRKILFKKTLKTNKEGQLKGQLYRFLLIIPSLPEYEPFHTSTCFCFIALIALFSWAILYRSLSFRPPHGASKLSTQLGSSAFSRVVIVEVFTRSPVQILKLS